MIFVRSLIARAPFLQPISIVGDVGQDYQDMYLVEVGGPINNLFSSSGTLTIQAQIDELNNGTWVDEPCIPSTVAATGAPVSPFRVRVGLSRTYLQGARVRLRLSDASTGLATPWTVSNPTPFRKWLIGVNQLPTYSVTFVATNPVPPPPGFEISRYQVTQTSAGNYDPGLNYYGMRKSFRYEDFIFLELVEDEASSVDFLNRQGFYDVTFEEETTGFVNHRAYNAVLFDGINGIQQNP